MAFLDDLNKKINQVSQTTANKMEISKINSTIAEDEKKVNQLYYQIGKLYLANHPEDYGEDYAQFVSQIVEINARIEANRKMIQKLKGVKQCPTCGADVEQNAMFCSNCGGEMPREENGERLVKCVSCNQFVAANVRFCTFCGSPMTQVQVPVQEAPQAPVQEAPVFAPAAPVAPAEPAAPDAGAAPVAAHCTQCGVVLEEGAAFCVNCGASVAQ